LPEVSIDIKGIDMVLKKLHGFNEIQRAEVMQAIKDGLNVIASQAKKTAPVDTGRYMSSIGATSRAKEGIHEVRTLGAEIVGRVGSRVKYAPYIELGTPPHIIRAKRKKALSFYWAKLGKTITVKSVQHPGTRARHILENAVRIKADTVRRMISQAVERAAKKF